MPTNHDSSSQTGQPDSPWRIHKAYYLLVFAAVAAGIYQWGKTPPSEGSAEQVESTAKIYYEPVDDSRWRQSADPERFEREITSTENLRQAVRRLGCQVSALPDETPEATVMRTVERIRRGLHVTASDTAALGRVEVALTFRGRPVDDPARMVNGLAEDFAESIRRDHKEQTRRVYDDARQASQAAELEFTRAKARLDGFSDRHFQQLESATEPPETDAPILPPPDPRPTVIDNPDWIALTGQLDELIRSRAEMLIDMTELHPKVLQINIEIAALQQRLQTVARLIHGSPATIAGTAVPQPLAERPATTQRQAELAQTVQSLKANADTAEETYRQASQTERAAWQRHQQQPRIELMLAGPTVLPASHQPPTGLLSVALAAGLAAVAGMGLFSTGVAMEPTLNTVDQIEAALTVPVIGTVAAITPADDSSAVGPWQSVARAALIFTGLLLIAGCAAAAAWATR
ncbi:MAG: hypothetical protein HQ567_07770 [Candidatus Nealsonbacteria bacterium]|nr:hypothetical protein [Candidatus Nealsonbacteria bacterium]